MERNKRVSALQLYLMITLSIGMTNHVILIPVLLHIGKRDSWLGAAVSTIPLIIWICLLYIVIKQTAQLKVRDWLKMRFGMLVTVPLIIIVVSIWALQAIATLKDIVTWTNVSYLPRTPAYVINFVFMLFCFFAAWTGLRAIAIMSGLLLPAVVFLGYFVMGANFQYKDYSLLTPLFTHGYEPVLKSVILTCGASFELITVLFLQHHASSKIRLSSLLILSVCLIGLTVGPLTGAIAIFGPFEAAELRYPAFEQWRMVTMGKYISHLDFFSIYQWVSGACVRMSLFLFLIPDVVGVTKPRTRIILLIGLSLFFFALGLYPVEDNWFIQQLQTWYYPLMFAVGLFLLFTLLVLTFLPVKRKERRT